MHFFVLTLITLATKDSANVARIRIDIACSGSIINFYLINSYGENASFFLVSMYVVIFRNVNYDVKRGVTKL